MTDWGLPNWEDESSYGDTAKWTISRWHWEFIRRREDVREEFDRLAEETFQTRIKEAQSKGKPASSVLAPDQPGFKVPSLLSKTVQLHALPNPRISNQPSGVIIFRTAVRIVQGVQLPGDAEIPHLSASHVKLQIDLSKPLASQIKVARSFLEREQMRLGGQVVIKRRRSDKWLTYLRALDARENGASLQAIADKDLVMSARTRQAASDTLNAARKLFMI